ncbi:DUF3455 domain-containing protein [Janthinobacterium sp. J1-1]|uniref:DUF3455 domain-containing protein n=1 Tax=Janthinobacterium sp. J1-1 TaxID=3065910 RepID=UPI0028125939|nr:DUF3455 domain-containing protein [Janthinobacterium sp. J1-1]
MHITTIAIPLSALLLTACAPMAARYSQDALPATVQVPAGHQVAMQTVGVGKIAYECKAKKDMSGHEWVFGGPDAVLNDRGGMQVGTYVGPPATWASRDGSAVTATQVAVAPAGAGNIPYQLVKANPATGSGAMQGVSYIQRVATQGGVAPMSACSASNLGAKQWVPYQADYIFWKAA